MREYVEGGYVLNFALNPRLDADLTPPKEIDDLIQRLAADGDWDYAMVHLTHHDALEALRYWVAATQSQLPDMRRAHEMHGMDPRTRDFVCRYERYVSVCAELLKGSY